MQRFANGSQAPYGLYVSTKPFDIRLVNGAGERLQGLQGASYMRLPMWMVVAFGPAFGGAFVLLFPLLVLASPLAALLGRLQTADSPSLAVTSARGGFQPAMSYFKGDGEAQDGAQTHGAGPASNPEVADLQGEVEARKGGHNDA